ncbi:glycoside hydrolase family 97 catalytic domain-containing protein [Wenyingzhuangia sp. IMCC45467]
MKKYLIITLSYLCIATSFSQTKTINGPNGNIKLQINVDKGQANYTVTYKEKTMLESSPLGLITNVGDFSKDLKLLSIKENKIDEHYNLDRIKKSSVHYIANEFSMTFSNNKNQEIEVVFRISNNDIGFRYQLPTYGETLSCIIEKEITGFNFTQQTTTFLTPQATPMIGWKRTKPSYEEEYIADDVLGAPSKYGQGFTFPGLFHVGQNGWVLISETGVNSQYCASHLSEGTKDGVYTIAFPNQKENNGIGSTTPAVGLPAVTPWRTITVADELKPIAETTIPFDLVKPLYKPSQEYNYGRSTWSWIMWQDNSINYQDQIAYIDLASELGYEFALIDGLWKKNIGYQKMEALFTYAKSKNVAPFVWYNSNGGWNDAPQGPRGRMNTSIARKKEMKWLQAHGVKGIKVDFFGGDKQTTMKLYEDILSDANDYGIMVIFHGCTLPRGWERMYPNYVGSEAVLASENLIFTQRANDIEAFSATLHPFIRNAVGAMEFGPVLLNKRHNRNNDGGRTRFTTDVFQLATAVLFQSSVQMFAIAPNNLNDAPAFAIDFMKEVPTTWDETILIDGYPGKYCVLARKHKDQWYVAGINAQDKPITLKINLPMLAGEKVDFYTDDKHKTSAKKQLKIKNSGSTKITIQPNGGAILVN